MAWAEPDDVHQLFHGAALTLSGIDDTNDIGPAIAAAQRWARGRLRIATATMDAWTSPSATPDDIRYDLIAPRAAYEVITHSRGGGEEKAVGWANFWNDRACALLDDINAGVHAVDDGNGGTVGITSRVSASHDATDRTFTMDKMENL